MPEQGILLELPEQDQRLAPKKTKPARGRPKLVPIDRCQLTLRAVDVEQLIAPDHKARAIWELSGKLDLSRFRESILSEQGSAGRPAWDPRLLLSLWVYSYSEGVTSARELEELMAYEPGLQWLTGLKQINHHTLSDFRVNHGEELDELFAQLLVVLQEAKLLTLERVMHDGTKVRAQAGGDSFRREPTVREQLVKARELVQEDPQREGGRRREAAQQRARQEREQKLSQAWEELEKIRQGKRTDEDKQGARVSVNEPEARIMKHGDNAIAASYNVQVSTDSVAGVIVGVGVSQSSDDAHQLVPAMDEVKKNLGRDPKQVVADGGYTNRDSIEQMAARKIDFIGSLPDAQERSEAAMKAVGIDPQFAPHFFIFQAENQTLQCPAGKTLEHWRANQKRGNQYQQYRAEGTDCVSCRYQKQCCPRTPWKGRIVSRLESEPEVVAEFRNKIGSEPAQQIYRQRGAIAEFPFAKIKEQFGVRKFRLFGMAKARMEMVWACLAYNVMIWIRKCAQVSPQVASVA